MCKRSYLSNYQHIQVTTIYQVVKKVFQYANNWSTFVKKHVFSMSFLLAPEVNAVLCLVLHPGIWLTPLPFPDALQLGYVT